MSYYKTRLKQSERPHETLQFAVIDSYGHVVAYCETETRAVLIEHALNNYVAGSNTTTNAI